MHILIAEDQPDSRLVLQKTLQGAGHQVTTAYHGKDALDKARQNPPEIIISDILMPVMDGFKFCYSVKNDDRLRHIPFIFYTATYVDIEDERLAMGLGASGYIIKPLDPQDFLRILDEVIAEVTSGQIDTPDTTLDDPLQLFKLCGGSLAKKLEAKVRELDIYRSIYQQAKNPICILSPEGTILQTNPAHDALFEDTRCHGIGESFSTCLGTEQLPLLLAAVDRGEPYIHEFSLPRDGRNDLHLDLFASGIRDETDSLSALIVISRDQTQRRESDQQLIRFRRMVDLSNDAFFLIDAPTSRIIDINEKACVRYGYSRDEMLQLTIIDINPTYRDINAWHRRLEQIGENKAALFESEHISKDGRRFPVEISHQFITDEEGQDIVIAVLRDISERKAHEQKEAETAKLWQRTFDSSTDIITIQDLSHKITQCNEKTAEAFEMTREECLGKTCYELFSGLDKPCPGCPIPAAVENFEPYAEEVIHEHLGKIFSVNVSPLINDAGEISGIAHFAKDITEQKKLAEQLRQTQKMESLGTLAGGIAHDFNNILSAILGYSQLAQVHLPKGSQAELALKQVVTGGQRAAELVKQILSFSRKTEYRLVPVAVQKIISETMQLLRPSIPTTIEIKQDVDQSCPEIVADPVEVHQIIMNLCTNAYHAMREQKSGTLTISLQQKKIQQAEIIPELDIQTGGYLQLSISDTGTGMDEATRERIFEPYFTTKKLGEGTGLGLAVAHSIIHDFGGKIAVYSELGKGTCFNIYLPVPVEIERPEEELSPPIEAPTGSERLLIVDDEEPIADLIKTMLENYGYQVTNYYDSSEALRSYQQTPELFDLVLTDYSMPKMHGITLAEELLKITPDLPILLCTGFNDTGNEGKALKAGIKTCLSKPIQAGQLALAVRAALDGQPSSD